jgi:hypothetical protein
VETKRGVETMLVAGAPLVVIVSRASERVTIRSDASYAEGNAFGQLYVLTVVPAGSGSDDVIEVQLFPRPPAPLSHDAARALAEQHIARRHGSAIPWSSTLASSNGTLRVRFSSSIDGGDLYEVVVGLHTHTVIPGV